MRSRTIALILVVLFALAACGSATKDTKSETGSTTPATALKVESTDLGKIASTSDGRTVYTFDKDSKGASTSACTGTCMTMWPAVIVTTAPKADGISAKVGTVATADGKQQATLNGSRLYYYAGDGGSGDVNGQGVDGTWWVVDPSGNKVTATPSAPGGGY